MKITVVLGLGSNLPDGERYIAAAVDALNDVLTDVRVSTTYTTDAIGGSGLKYTNAVMAGTYSGDLQTLNRWCKDYEQKFGRTSQARAKGLVPIDIDVVVADHEVLRTDDFKQVYFTTGYNMIFLKNQ